MHLSSLVGPDPERAAAQGQIRKRLERAIDDLPPAFRAVLILRDVEEISGEEAATLLGIQPETVRTRLHRARRLLREALGEQLASALKDAFPFERSRCDRLVERDSEPGRPYAGTGALTGPSRFLIASIAFASKSGLPLAARDVAEMRLRGEELRAGSSGVM